MNTAQSSFQRETESKKATKSNLLCSGSVVYVTAVVITLRGLLKSTVYFQSFFLPTNALFIKT
jgi:hypothetical protein